MRAPAGRAARAFVALVVGAVGLALAASCGSGGNGHYEDDPPVATIEFPPPNSIGDSMPFAVLVSATDDTGTAAVTVNGHVAAGDPASKNPDPKAPNQTPKDWTALAHFLPGDNLVQAHVRDVVGNAQVAAASETFRQVPIFAPPNALAFDAVSSRVVVAYPGAIASVDPTSVDPVTAGRLYVANALTGFGPGIDESVFVEVDAANMRLLVVDRGQKSVIAVDPGTGNRTVLSDAVTGTGPALDGAAAAAFDPAGQRVLVVLAGNPGSVVAVALATGNRTLLSGGAPPVGMGPALTTPRGAVFHAATNRLFVAEKGAKSVLAVDLATGSRSVFSGGTAAMPVGAGTLFGSVDGLALDLAGARLLVPDATATAQAIWAVALATGARTTLSAATTGVGPALRRPGACALDVAGNRLLVADFPSGLLAVALATGDRTELSALRRGTGPDLVDPRDAESDAAGAFVYVLDATPQVVRVSVATGDRTVVSGPAVGAGPLLVDPRDAVLDEPKGRLFVVDASLRSVLVVSLATGDRTTLTGPGVGAGPEFAAARGLAAELTEGRLYVADGALPAVISIELATGNRSILAGAGTPFGTEMLSLRGITARNPAKGRGLYVADAGAKKVWKVDPVSGVTAQFLDLATFGAGERVAISADGTVGLVTTIDASSLRWFDPADAAKGAAVMTEPDILSPGPGRLMGVCFDAHLRVVYAVDAFQLSLVAADRTSRYRALISR